MQIWQAAPRNEIAQMLYAQAAAKSVIKTITVDQVLHSARKKTGLEDFGENDFLPRLEVLLESINHEARLNPLGFSSTGIGMPVDMLRGRLELVEAQKQHPDVFTTPITRPIFIVGGSRTGTTLLQRLLACDARLATPLLWQMSSTKTFAFGTDEQRSMQHNRADTGQKMLHMLNPSMKAVHYSEADGPEECVLMMGTDLRNLALMSCINTPAYSTLLASEDFREAYSRHKQQLQLLDYRVRIQREGIAPRWLLKAPYHLPTLEALASIYPDACIVHTHRNVVETVTSTCSLYSVFRGTFSDEVNPLEVGQQQTKMLSAWFNGTVVARNRLKQSGVTFFDAHYTDLVANPLSMAEKILQFAGLEPTPEGRAAMQEWLATNGQGKHGSHKYMPEEFGLDTGEIKALTEPYRQAFGVE